MDDDSREHLSVHSEKQIFRSQGESQWTITIHAVLYVLSLWESLKYVMSPTNSPTIPCWHRNIRLCQATVATHEHVLPDYGTEVCFLVGDTRSSLSTTDQVGAQFTG